ncbi:MAG TPA: hypothetical protein VNA25_20285 [Phycisphaerae bacterium]|nr:hypothetical protein [Phycisphaerae bacterium]
MEAFEKELTYLINQHSIENVADMPDFLLAGMICRMIEAVGPSVKNTLDWYGVDSVCHPAPNKGNEIPAWVSRLEKTTSGHVYHCSGFEAREIAKEWRDLQERLARIAEICEQRGARLKNPTPRDIYLIAKGETDEP